MKELLTEWRSYLSESEDSTESAKIVLTDGEKFLMLKNDYGWDLPGGHIKVDEDPAVALKREVEEETGLKISDPKKIGGHKHFTFFKSSIPSGKIKLSDEHTDHKFYRLEDLENIQVVKHFADAIRKALGEE